MHMHIHQAWHNDLSRRINDCLGGCLYLFGDFDYQTIFHQYIHDAIDAIGRVYHAAVFN